MGSFYKLVGTFDCLGKYLLSDELRNLEIPVNPFLMLLFLRIIIICDTGCYITSKTMVLAAAAEAVQSAVSRYKISGITIVIVDKS